MKNYDETLLALKHANCKVAQFEKEIVSERERIAAKIKELTSKANLSQFQEDELNAFIERPYVEIPKKKDEWYVLVPKFIDFQVGWLERSTESYNIFVVNKFVDWLAQIPEDLRSHFKFKEKLPLKVYDEHLLTGSEHQEVAWERYKHLLSRREGKDKIRVKRGKEFALIASLIDDGILPFIPKPVQEEHLREYTLKFTLRDYQEQAWQKFLETGAVGVFWPFSAGKTFIGIHAIANLTGKKLVAVPTTTLVEQWTSRIREYGGYNLLNEVDIVTYHSFHKIQNKDYRLVVFDELHHLPANTFSRFSTIKAEYRIGLSATPYREDGRTDYIFALSGFPLGLDWKHLQQLGVFTPPDIRLFILGSQREKEDKLEELLRLPLKTVVFCDSIQLGKKLSKKHGIPFVYGATSNRLEIIKEAEQSIVSRVGDEGLSISDIERVIEIDFHFGSRRQEGQRLGRVFHGEEKGEHVILMTNQEHEAYQKRLYAIHEKGFKIEVIR